MKITAFNDLYPVQLATTGPTTSSASGSNNAFGGDVTGDFGDLRVVGLTGTVALASNLNGVLGDVLTIIQTTPRLAQFATPSNSAGSNTLLRTSGGAGEVTTIAASGAAQTLMVGGANYFDVTLTANCTISFTGWPAAGSYADIGVRITEDGTGGHTLTFSGVTWLGGTTPTHDSTAGVSEEYEFWTIDGGTTVIGGQLGASSSLTVKDEGTPLATAATSLDFVGAGVTASGTGAAKTITIPGGSASPLTTKGDLYTFAAADARLAVGSNGQFVVADPLEATDLRWTNNPAVGEILISSTPSSPLVFDDLLTNSTGDDLVYGSR